MSDGLGFLLEDLHHGVSWPVDDIEFQWSIDGLEPVKKERSPLVRRMAVVAAALGVFALVLIVSPQARQAVASLLEVAGIRITFSEDLPLPGSEMDLGDPIRMEDVIDRIDFPIRVPIGATPGVPDAVYLDGREVVSMAWSGREQLPSAGATRVGILFSQWADDSGPIDGVKTASSESTTVTPVLVEGSTGLWIAGAKHTLTVVGESGVENEEIVRLAANVLIWTVDGINYRIETTGDLNQALELVDSLQAVAR